LDGEQFKISIDFSELWDFRLEEVNSNWVRMTNQL